MASHALSIYALAQFNNGPHLDIHNLPHGNERVPIPRNTVVDALSRRRNITAPLHPTSDHASATQPLTGAPIPLPSRIVHKFYEPVILLASLMDVVTPHRYVAGMSEASVNTPGTDIQSFKAFLNKLSHVCSSSKGHETVTSFLVLRDRTEENTTNGRIHYWFVVNEETPDNLMDTQTYVEKLLRKVKHAPGCEDPEGLNDVRKELHRDVLVFNRRRISYYLRDIQDQTSQCLQRCTSEKTNESRLLSKLIDTIRDDGNIGASHKDPETDYISKVQATIRLLLQLEKSDSYSVILGRAEEGRLMPGSTQECFSDFVHTSKRILAYPQSVQYILTVAKNRWPELFDNPLVSFLPSSKKIPRPYREKSLTAVSIVGRMTRKVKEMAIFKDFVKRLQIYDLDDRIQELYARKSFTPIVHSEVLLLNWVWNTYGGAADGIIDQSVFFNGWMYIGSSKPTCRLCHYYFEERRSGVEHRSDWHGNLYPAWAFPEVFPSQGENAIADRQIMVDRVLQRVRKEAFQVVRKKIAPKSKEEDSNTFTEGVTLEDRWTIQPSEIDEITSMLGEMNTEDYDEEEDGGGAVLGEY